MEKNPKNLIMMMKTKISSEEETGKEKQETRTKFLKNQ